MPERNMATTAGGTPSASESQQYEPERTPAEIVRHKSPSSHNRNAIAHSPGSTINPKYGERRPMTYNILETELEAVSSFNGEALRYFSFGSFFVAMILNIIISYAFSNGPLTDLGHLLLYRATLAIGVLALVFFSFGVWAVLKRKSIVDRIKSETISPPTSG